MLPNKLIIDFISTALIPFAEFKDPKTQKDYAITIDNQVITHLDNLNLHKDVRCDLRLK